VPPLMTAEEFLVGLTLKLRALYRTTRLA